MNHGLDAFYKKAALKVLQNSLENTNDRVSILTKLQASTCNFIEIVTLAMVFSSEFCEIFKNISLQNTFGVFQESKTFSEFLIYISLLSVNDNNYSYEVPGIDF